MLQANRTENTTIDPSIETLLSNVNIPDEPQERLSVFEDLIIDYALHVVLKQSFPSVTNYFDFLLNSSPTLRFTLKNRLGQAGIKALAGVATVMLKGVDSQTIKRALPGVMAMFMHHLLEVVSDKLDADQVAKALNTPEELNEVFSGMAYELLGGMPFDNVAIRFTNYLQESCLRELNLPAVVPAYASVIDMNQSGQFVQMAASAGVEIDDNQLSEFLKHPIKHFLTLNLQVIGNARDQLESAMTLTDDGSLRTTGQAVLYEFGMQGLCARYYANSITQDLGYADMPLDQAIEVRSFTILTNYTMAAVISALAATDENIWESVENDRFLIESAIGDATRLIGLANDCGSRILRMNERDIYKEIAKLIRLDKSAGPRNNPAIKSLLDDARAGKLAPQYHALFPLIKDSGKGETNMAYDLELSLDEDHWERVIYNVQMMAREFQRLEVDLIDQLHQIQLPYIADLIANFVNYNFQIYDIGADYDHARPVIEQLPIIQSNQNATVA